MLKQGINFIPVGNATREDETKEVSFEPDESYYLGEKKAHPDLAIEIAREHVTFEGNQKAQSVARNEAIPL